MGANKLDELLEKMPEIAKAVNAFTSEAVQQRAFGVLVGSFGADDDELDADLTRDVETDKGEDAPPKPPSRRAAKAAAKKTSAPAKKKAPAGTPKMVNDLNLRPNGKQAFKDFAAEKVPKSQDEKNTVVLYYLKHTLGVDTVTADHVFTAYRSMKDEGWKTPGNLRNSLQVTKSTKGWVDTSDMDDIQLPIAGTNMVEHDLPKKPAKK